MVQNGTENILQKFVVSVFYATDNFLMFSADSYLYLAPVRCLLSSKFLEPAVSAKYKAGFCYCVNSESGLEELKIQYLHENRYG